MASITSRNWLANLMSLLRVVVVAVMMFAMTTNGIVKVHSRSTLSDSMLKARLNSLNKPAVKMIQSEDGDIIDCIDINKQPAFDHPLLKNHTIQKQPSFVPATKKNSSAAAGQVLRQTWRKGGSRCPEGTVPIRRVRMSDLRKIASLKSFGRRDSTVDMDHAGLKLTKGGPYYGAKASINAWAVSVEPNEWSHSAIHISDAFDNYIEAGWLVNPSIFGDGLTRIYTFWTGDCYQNTGCYNMLCSGFVQTSKNIALGAALDPLSTLGGRQFIMQTEVYRDKNSGNWWLKIKEEPVGYWPKEIFSEGKFEQVQLVKWIGSVLDTRKNGHHTSTQMGSGRFAKEGFKLASFFANVYVLDPDLNFVKPDFAQLYSTNWGCYGASLGNPGSDITFYYGGPGGDGCDEWFLQN